VEKLQPNQLLMMYVPAIGEYYRINIWCPEEGQNESVKTVIYKKSGTIEPRRIA
jgi:hypothetical protein